MFDADALNALFNTLHSNSGSKTIYIHNNPKETATGTNGCTKGIATGKGWVVNASTAN
jgi:hypothetical protein